MRRTALVVTAVVLLTGAASAVAAPPTLPAGSTGTASGGWRNSRADSAAFRFIGSVSFGDGSYTGVFQVSGTDLVLGEGGGTATPVARCVVRHTEGRKVDSDAEPNGSFVAPAAAVLRCTGHLTAGPDTTTTLVVTLSDGWYERRLGDYSWSSGSYAG